MYLSYEYLGSMNKWVSPNWRIIDTDFIETDLSHSLWSSIVRVYERRNKNVIKNLIKAISVFDHNVLTTQELFQYVISSTPNIEPYINELEKYILLM